MTYDKALEILNQDGEYSTFRGATKKRIIVPLTLEYFEPFNKQLLSRIVSKDEVFSFADDGQFTIWEYNVLLLKGEVFTV